MDYPIENLGPEKFQMFSQALLLTEYPGLQCFPVGQPDGGRDATQIPYDVIASKRFIMFQVKFARHPLKESDPHKWLLEIIKDEIPKVKKQIVQGARQFVLITNIPGTAHPEVGSIDIANKLLTEALELPSIAWWRDDVNRRLDNAWNLKWAYPELMTGPDLIRAIVENNLTEDQERRSSVLRTFIAAQYRAEQNVKFKQVDLNNKLLDLFIDVPLRRIRGFNEPTVYSGNYSFHPESLITSSHELFETEEELQHHYQRTGTPQTGAASFVLGQSPIHNSFLVLEGAPGQGKSTITQYICQVHRMRLLNKTSELRLVEPSHREAPVRLPIKVDLRDFAMWLARRNPFLADSPELPAKRWMPSLEAFLAALLEFQSGGAFFNVTDLHAVASLSSILLVLDGLDEVAEINVRSDVVKAIEEGAERLASISASLSVVVASRPTAFENSPGLSRELFRHESLDHITPDLIESYAKKWVRARLLTEKEGSEVKKILRHKLDQPHLRDLARNPMQLAILLSLVHTRGVSLPDKRTALYDSYVELFFNREAEKASIVRDNRDLLIDIHQYLAWLLHVESEQASGEGHRPSAGAIEETRLKSVLRDYLISQGTDPSLTEAIFTGVVERVVAIVSRVQGTFEFEVQPLREYFAARFLHETAPYSPSGFERRGTLPDRFDALSRNFYWLNVTRFYAGCYSKGELASLIDRLKELIQDPDFAHLSHPRILAATLLSDWVFKQHPKSVPEVIRLVLDGIGLRFLLSTTSRRQENSQPLVLPDECGRKELVNHCFSMISNSTPHDFALDVIDLLRANGTREEIALKWKEMISSEDGLTWFRYGSHLGCMHLCDLETLSHFLDRTQLTSELMECLIRARRFDYIEQSEQTFDLAIHALLDRAVDIGTPGKKLGMCEKFGLAIDASRYAYTLTSPSHAPLGSSLKRQLAKGANINFEKNFLTKQWPAWTKAKFVVENTIEALKVPVSVWRTNLAPWDTVVSSIQASFGFSWSAIHLAVLSGAIKSSSEKGTDCSDLFDEEKSLCHRTRYARLRKGVPGWWARTCIQAKTVEQKMLFITTYFVWASHGSISQTIGDVLPIVDSLPDESWAKVFDSVVAITRIVYSGYKERGVYFHEEDIAAVQHSPRVLGLFQTRVRSYVNYGLYVAWRSHLDCNDLRLHAIFQNDAAESLFGMDNDRRESLRLISRGFQLGVPSQRFASQTYFRQRKRDGFPLELAEEVLNHAEKYPTFIVAAAEMRFREETSKKVRRVGEVAQHEGWFEE